MAALIPSSISPFVIDQPLRQEPHVNSRTYTGVVLPPSTSVLIRSDVPPTQTDDVYQMIVIPSSGATGWVKASALQQPGQQAPPPPPPYSQPSPYGAMQQSVPTPPPSSLYTPASMHSIGSANHIGAPLPSHSRNNSTTSNLNMDSVVCLNAGEVIYSMLVLCLINSYLLPFSLSIMYLFLHLCVQKCVVSIFPSMIGTLHVHKESSFFSSL